MVKAVKKVKRSETLARSADEIHLIRHLAASFGASYSPSSEEISLYVDDQRIIIEMFAGPVTRKSEFALFMVDQIYQRGVHRGKEVKAYEIGKSIKELFRSVHLNVE